MAAAVDRDIVSLYPVQVAYPHFDISFGCFVFGLGLFAFQSISLGLYRSFFIIGGEGLFVPAATVGFAMVFRRICADRDWVVSFCG